MSQDDAPIPILAPPEAENYWRVTRTPIYSAALVLPFILIYETGLILLNTQVINGGDAIVLNMISPLFRLIGAEASVASSVLVLILCFAVWQMKRKGPWSIHPPVLAAMFFESLLYAVLLFMLLGYFAQYLPHGGSLASLAPAASHARSAMHPALQDFVLYCGAGVYEELVFRVMLLGLLMLVFTKLFHMEHAYAAAWSVVVGAIIFSAFHHIGGQKFAWGIFLQRVLAGLYFSAIYFNRSFGVAVASHALYDILVGLDHMRG